MPRAGAAFFVPERAAWEGCGCYEGGREGLSGFWGLWCDHNYNPVNDDSTLLRRYAANRDEAAFAEVVRRHLPFVYSAALRRLGRDTHRAQDVAQVVFCALARDAQHVARYPVLSGWLYTATRNAVINVVRGEKRRRAREEEAGHMRQIESESTRRQIGPSSGLCSIPRWID